MMVNDTAAPRRSAREHRVPRDGISGGGAARPEPRAVVKLVRLPPPNPKRWTARRKAEVVAAVRSGRIGADEACRRYRLSSEELQSWQRLVERHGLMGLRATRIQEFRESAGRAEETGAERTGAESA